MTRRSDRRRPRALCGEPVRTLAEVAQEMGISAERARQLESNGLRKLKAALEARGFTFADFFD